MAGKSNKSKAIAMGIPTSMPEMMKPKTPKDVIKERGKISFEVVLEKKIVDGKTVTSGEIRPDYMLASPQSPGETYTDMNGLKTAVISKIDEFSKHFGKAKEV